MASLTSSALPTCVPSGCSMPVTSARIGLPACAPISTIAFASAMESSSVCISAPLPVFTSSTIAPAPLASFLDTMLEAISGMQSTVPVTSRSA